MRFLPLSLSLASLIAAAPATSMAQGVIRASAAPAPQLSWAQKMFSDLKFDFGYVAKNSDVRRQVVITNSFNDEITISNISTTCRCGQPALVDPNDPTKTVPQLTLKTWETGILSIRIDTVAHSGHRHPTISADCRFKAKDGRTYTETVRIPLSVDIRSDLTVTPGSADFGAIDYGTAGERHVSVMNSSFNSGNWAVKEVRSANPHVTAELRQVSRANGRTEYDVAVRLSREVPVGELREQLTLVTTDPSNPNIPVLVRATVVPEFQVIPAVVQLGNVASGTDRTVTVVVKSKKPFAIEKYATDAKPESVQVKLTPEAKSLHILPIRISPTGDAGDLKMTINLTVAGREVPVTFTAEGKLQNAATAKK